MSDNEKVSGFDAPGPDNFDFDKYVSGKSTFPTFKHTVYLDQERGASLALAIERYDDLVGKLNATVKLRDRALESGVLGLVDDDFTKMTEDIDAFEAELKELESEIDLLQSEIQASSMTLHFQANTPKKFGSVVRKAEKAYEKKNGKGSGDEDYEYITGKTEAVLIAQVTEYCTHVTTPQSDVKRPAPSEESVANLVGSLISSETMRLLLAVNKGLDSSGKWAERIDAGFPGRGAVVGSEPVGRAGAEGGKVVGDSASGDAWGEEERLV